MDKIYLVSYYDDKYLLYANNKKEAIDKIYEMFYTNDDILKKDMTADRILEDKDVVEVII